MSLLTLSSGGLLPAGILLSGILLRVHELVDDLPLVSAGVVEVGVQLCLLLGPLLSYSERERMRSFIYPSHPGLQYFILNGPRQWNQNKILLKRKKVPNVRRNNNSYANLKYRMSYLKH